MFARCKTSARISASSTKRKPLFATVVKILEGDPASSPPGIQNAEAIYTIAFFFCILGTVPATLYSAVVYWGTETAYYGVEVEAPSDNPYLSYCPDVYFPEPFATVTNLCFWFGGLGMFLLPYMSGDDLPPKTFGLGALIVFLGASSFTFHGSASQTGSWRHAIDKIGMLCVFGFLSVTVLHGLFQTYIGKPSHPRSNCGVGTNIAAMVMVMMCVIYQDSIDTTLFLAFTGLIIFTGNGIGFGILSMRARQDDEHDLGEHRIRNFLYGFIYSFMPKFICLLCGLLVNIQAEKNRNFALCSIDNFRSSHLCKNFDILPTNYTGVNDDTIIQGGVDARKQHDFSHGSWHFLSSFSVMAMSLSALETMSGSLTSDQWSSPSEFGSIAAAVTIAILFMILEFTDCSSDVFLGVWVGIMIVFVPFSVSAMAQTIKSQRDHIRLELKRAKMSVEVIRCGSFKSDHQAAEVHSHHFSEVNSPLY